MCCVLQSQSILPPTGDDAKWFVFFFSFCSAHVAMASRCLFLTCPNIMCWWPQLHNIAYREIAPWWLSTWCLHILEHSHYRKKKKKNTNRRPAAPHREHSHEEIKINVNFLRCGRRLSSLRPYWWGCRGGTMRLLNIHTHCLWMYIFIQL